jgi:hypothetical protein
MASLCNDEQGRLGAMSGHGRRPPGWQSIGVAVSTCKVVDLPLRPKAAIIVDILGNRAPRPSLSRQDSFITQHGARMFVRLSRGRCPAGLHAQGVGSLPDIAALAQVFIQMGVEFERPIINDQVSRSALAAQRG